jgi:non-ribosomal peptide synthetase component F
MLVIRTDLSASPSFNDLLGRVREVTLGAFAHQDLPFQKLVEELQPERNPGRSPLFQVAFVLQNAPMPSVSLSGLTLTSLPSEVGRVQFDLILMIEENPEGLNGLFAYNRDLFDPATIARMADDFENLLTQVLADPTQRLSQLRLLPEEMLKGQRPENFPDVHLTQKDMESILLEINGR